MASHKPLSEYLASELDSHSCAICYERMDPPDRSPMLLFPCGHTLCRQCLTSHLAKAPKKTCPLCRAVIQSQAVNISLQQLIQSLAAKQSALKGSASASAAAAGGLPSDLGDLADETDVSRYIQQYNQSSLRCAVLATKLSDLSSESQATSEALRSCELVTAHLQREEQAVAERLAGVQAELDLVREHLAAQRSKAEELEEMAQRQQATRAAVAAILEPLERERDKAQLIVRRLAPNVQLQPVNYPAAAAAASASADRSAGTQAAAAGAAASRPSSSAAAAAAGSLLRPSSSSSAGSGAAGSSSSATAGAAAAAPFSTTTQPWPFPAQSTRRAR